MELNSPVRQTEERTFIHITIVGIPWCRTGFFAARLEPGDKNSDEVES